MHIMATSKHRHLSVLHCENPSPNIRRITLGGPELEGFPDDQESAYIKLILPDSTSRKGFIMRTYTIRKHRSGQKEFDIDFVQHGNDSPGSTWAKQAQVGDSIKISGPGAKKLIDFSADWFLLVGDMTALPAISVNIEQLPHDAKGYAVIEVMEASDIQAIPTPDNFDIHWLINPQPGSDNSLLLNKVKALDWPDGRPSIWAACEFNDMRALRHHFKKEKNVDKNDLYISSYWKKGVSEEKHKVVKQLDALLPKKPPTNP